MRRILAAGAVLVLAAACSAGAQPNQTTASGRNGQRAFEVGDFHGIQVRGTQDVVVAVGGAPSVRAEGDTAALEGLEIAVENGTLKIGTRRGWSWRGPGGHVTVHVTVPSLDAASITGTGDMRIDTVQAQSFQASVTGTGLTAWPDGRVVAGASRETGSGFDVSTTAAGVHEVLGEALRVAPGLADAELREIRVGLRPMSSDGLPILGPVPRVPGAWIATGHGPFGLTLGPYSAQLVADMILGHPVEPDLTPFALSRFPRATDRS